MKLKLFAFVLLTVILVTSCASTQTAEEDKLVVFTSITPQKYFVDRIGGDLVDVNVMVEAGSSPATYEPKASQMTALSDAAAYFSIGVPFESAWLEKIAAANQEMLMVDTTEGIERRIMGVPHTHEGEEADHDHEEEDEADHDHEEEGEADHDHEEGELDPHVWLSPELVKIQAVNIHAALVELAPEHEEVFSQNLEAFLADINALEDEMQSVLSGVSSHKFMVFHPSWGYFADQFGLEMIAIEVGGTEPSAAELAELIEEAKEEGIQVVFAQPEFSTQDAETIANAIDGEVILINPLAYDWLENMRDVAQTFAEVLK